MAANKHPGKRPPRVVWKYLRLTGWGWWLAVATLFGAYDQIVSLDQVTRVLPDAQEWKQKVPWFPEAVAFVALLAGPYIAFLRLHRKFEEVCERVRADDLEIRKTALAARLELKLGKASQLPLEQRKNLGVARLQDLEREVRLGNVSGVTDEILAIQGLLLEIFSEATVGQGRLGLIKRVHDLVAAVELHHGAACS